MAGIWYWTWATVAFLSELAALAALGLWGSSGGPPAARVLLGLGLPVAAAVLWGLLAAPQAPVQVPALAVATKVVVYGAAALGLGATGHPRLALVLAAGALLGSVLTTLPPPPVSAPAAS